MKTTIVSARMRRETCRQERDVSPTLTLESQRSGLLVQRIVDKHDGEQELVPRADGDQDPERRHGRRHVDAPPGRCASSERLRKLTRHGREIGASRRCRRHVEADEAAG